VGYDDYDDYDDYDGYDDGFTNCTVLIERSAPKNLIVAGIEMKFIIIPATSCMNSMST